VTTKKLLLVEADRATREALQEVFINRGWEVAMVATPSEGLKLLCDYDPDWVIASWDQLEGMGDRFMFEVRAKSQAPHVAILTDARDPLGSAMTSRLQPDLQFRKPVKPEGVFKACEPGWTRKAVGG
jgi:DNA-binding response OmpR family regulator